MNEPDLQNVEAIEDPYHGIPYTDIDLQAKKKAFAKVAFDYHIKEIFGEPDKVKNELFNMYLKSLNDSQEESTGGKDWVWLTVNPNLKGMKPIEDADWLSSLVEKCVSKKWVKSYCAVFEQRFATENEFRAKPGSCGLHVHALIYRGKKNAAEVKRELFSTFRQIVGNEKHVHIKFVSKAESFVKLGYMQGMKSDAEKVKKCEVDKIMRKEFKLPDIIYNHQFAEEYTLEPLDIEDASSSIESQSTSSYSSTSSKTSKSSYSSTSSKSSV